MDRVLAASFTLLATCFPALSADAEPPSLRRTHVVRVFEANRQAIVNINTTQIVRQRFGLSNRDPFFDRFFGPRQLERDVKRTSLGSGFIAHREGYIVTNAHVVDGADSVEVILADGTELAAQVLASDARHDLAIIKVTPPRDRPLSAVRLGASSDLMVGEPVVAIGNPLGYAHSVTSGIISATRRTLQVDRDWKLEGLIQTDASINPGNSGGPLFNAYGQVIGITTAIRGDAQNIGFAIPVGRLRDLVPELLSPRVLRRLDVGGKIVEQRNVQPPANVQVTLRWQPTAGTATTVTAINSRPVANIFAAYVELLRVGANQDLKLSGPGGRVVASARVRAAPLSDGQRLARSMLGLRVRELAADDRARLRLGRVTGLLVTEVDPGGPGDRAGVDVGDVLVQVGRYRIAGLKQLAALLGDAEKGAVADIYLLRRGQLGRTRLRLGGRESIRL